MNLSSIEDTENTEKDELVGGSSLPAANGGSQALLSVS